MGLLFTQLHHPWPLLLAALLGGYLCGSVPYGLILTRLAGMGDIRKEGSGNIGATNVLRLGGKKLAVLTLLLDALKGALPVLVAKHFHMDYAVLAGVAAFFGHLFPVWLKFKGGKGVATGLGIAFGFSGLLGLLMCGVWMMTAAVGQYSSLSALVAFGLAPLLAMRLTGSFQITIVFFILGIMVWIRHRANIKRLSDGTEGKINFKKKETPPS